MDIKRDELSFHADQKKEEGEFRCDRNYSMLSDLYSSFATTQITERNASGDTSIPNSVPDIHGSVALKHYMDAVFSIASCHSQLATLEECVPNNQTKQIKSTVETIDESSITKRRRKKAKQCKMEGCLRSSTSRSLCTAHGGGRRCTIPICTKIAVSGGLCRKHGGGKRCQAPLCTKGSQSDSMFCWAHGGGKRCKIAGCYSSTKVNGICAAHHRMKMNHHQIEEFESTESPSLRTSSMTTTNSQETDVPVKKCSLSFVLN